MVCAGRGADAIILYTQPDCEAECRRLASGDVVDVVYDSIGKAGWGGSLNCLKLRGMIVTVGNGSGTALPFAPLQSSEQGPLFVARPGLND